MYLLHRKLPDYSLGQVAFAVFQALLAITQLLCHVSTLLSAPDIITVARCFRVYLLHRKFPDYSLGQVAFAVFQALLAITQLLCHVSALLTSACKQA